MNISRVTRHATESMQTIDCLAKRLAQTMQSTSSSSSSIVIIADRLQSAQITKHGTSIYIRRFVRTSVCTVCLAAKTRGNGKGDCLQILRGRPGDGFRRKKVGGRVFGRGPENLHCFPLHRPVRRGQLDVIHCGAGTQTAWQRTFFDRAAG